ncbi:MAG: C40 family peptidase [Bacteroidales bacterium]|nr:C40 family peptidase [Bacteroidales bacterium]
MKLSRPIIFTFIFASLLVSSCKSKSRVVLETPDTYPLPVMTERPTRPGKNNNKGTMVSPEVADAIVKEARRWIGTPYRYGGTTRKGTDCSGLVWTIYQDVAGIKLPRNSVKQFEYCIPLTREQLSPGDLVFFNTAGNGTRVGHVGIYIGNNSFIHSSSSKGVRVSTFDEPYYAKTYNRGGRIPEIPTKSR